MGSNEQRVVPFLTFSGNAKEAIEYYASIIPDSKIISLSYFGPGEQGVEGTVLNGTLEFFGMQIMVMDMDKSYAPEFSWATTLLLQANSDEEFMQLFNGFSQGGTVMMGPEKVYDIRKTAWVSDKFGVTWQIIWR